MRSVSLRSAFVLVLAVSSFVTKACGSNERKNKDYVEPEGCQAGATDTVRPAAGGKAAGGRGGSAGGSASGGAFNGIASTTASPTGGVGDGDGGAAGEALGSAPGTAGEAPAGAADL